MENLSIRFWAEDDRPREKMMLKGRSALSNAELLAILIGSGTKKKSAVEVAQEILNSCTNNLRQLSKASKTDLCAFDGIGDAKAITIMAAMELARRRDQESPELRVKISVSRDAYNYFKPFLTDLYQEESHALFLTQNNTIIRSEQLSKGGLTSTVVDQRVLFQKALEAKACGIILAHNHPSGALRPSECDIKLTKNLKEVSNVIGIPILDHLILTDAGYYSFADQGMM